MWMLGEDGTVVYASAWNQRKNGWHAARYGRSDQDGHGKVSGSSAEIRDGGDSLSSSKGKMIRLNAYVRYVGPELTNTDLDQYRMYGICQTSGGRSAIDCKSGKCPELFPKWGNSKGAQYTQSGRTDPNRAQFFSRVKFPGVAKYAKDTTDALLDPRSHFWCSDDKIGPDTNNDDENYFIKKDFEGVEHPMSGDPGDPNKKHTSGGARVWSFAELVENTRSLQTATVKVGLRGAQTKNGKCKLALEGYEDSDKKYGSKGKGENKPNDAWKMLLCKEGTTPSVDCEIDPKHKELPKFDNGETNDIYKMSKYDAMKGCATCGKEDGTQKDGVNVFDGKTNCPPDGQEGDGVPQFPDNSFQACVDDLMKTGKMGQLCAVAMEDEKAGCDEFDDEINEDREQQIHFKDEEFKAMKAEPEAVAPRVAICAGDDATCKDQKNYESLVNLPALQFDTEDWNTIKVDLGPKAGAGAKISIRFWQKFTDCSCCNDYAVDSLQFLTDETAADNSCKPGTVNDPGPPELVENKPAKCEKKELKEAAADQGDGDAQIAL
jgi:hypothetical protein